YGGNKVRTLEAVLGGIRARGVERIWSTGAYGSNHALATAIHAPRIGLATGAILFPQPASAPACANLGALLATGAPVIRLRTWAELPAAMAIVAARERAAGRRAFVM